LSIVYNGGELIKPNKDVFMKLTSIALLLPALFLCNAVKSAESYQSFSHVNYSKSEFVNTDNQYWSLGSRYYFDAKEALGPLDQFEYINAISNVSGTYSNNTFDSEYRFDGTNYESKSSIDSFDIGGEWFVGNLLVGGSYTYINTDYQRTAFSNDDDYNVYRATLGYLITDDLLVKVNMIKSEDTSAFYTISANYNLQLNKNDYVGFGYNTDEDLDVHHLSTQYFMALSQDSYFVLGGNYTFNNTDSQWVEDSWNINSSYYFNQYTSASVSYDKNEEYSIGANHFFNKSYALGLVYTANNSDDWVDSKTYSVNFTAQF
jgi:hypothetical protein